MRFSDEPIPDFPRPVAADVAGVTPGARQGHPARALEIFPGRATVVDQIARLLDQQPDEEAALEEFGRLVRLLVEVGRRGRRPRSRRTPSRRGCRRSEPEMLFGATGDGLRGVRAGARPELEAPGATRPFALPRPWDGRTNCCARRRTTR